LYFVALFNINGKDVLLCRLTGQFAIICLFRLLSNLGELYVLFLLLHELRLYYQKCWAFPYVQTVQTGHQGPMSRPSRVEFPLARNSAPKFRVVSWLTHVVVYIVGPRQGDAFAFNLLSILKFEYSHSNVFLYWLYKYYS